MKIAQSISRSIILALAIAVLASCGGGGSTNSSNGTDTGCADISTPDPTLDTISGLSVEALRAQEFCATLTFDRWLEDGPSFSAYLVSYQSSGLNVYAMVAVPITVRPEAGYPVLIANHGFHPDPPQYGINNGIDSRPGDYYRDIPEIYSREGFIVVMPDYRGHNNSEGLEFTHQQSGFFSYYYTQDVLALLSALPGLDDADLNNLFIWGHSLGGEVTLRTLLVDTAIRGATLWSPYTKPDSDPNSQEIIDSLTFLNTPLLVHHALDDARLAYSDTVQLVSDLDSLNKTNAFYSYASDNHLFLGEEQAIAVARDIEFFRSQFNQE